MTPEHHLICQTWCLFCGGVNVCCCQRQTGRWCVQYVSISLFSDLVKCITTYWTASHHPAVPQSKATKETSQPPDLSPTELPSIWWGPDWLLEGRETPQEAAAADGYSKDLAEHHRGRYRGWCVRLPDITHLTLKLLMWMNLKQNRGKADRRYVTRSPVICQCEHPAIPGCKVIYQNPTVWTSAAEVSLSKTHRYVLLHFLIFQRNSGTAVWWRRCEGEAVSDGALCSRQRLLEVLDVSLLLHLQLLCFLVHCCLTHCTDQKKKTHNNKRRRLVERKSNCKNARFWSNTFYSVLRWREEGGSNRWGIRWAYICQIRHAQWETACLWGRGWDFYLLPSTHAVHQSAATGSLNLNPAPSSPHAGSTWSQTPKRCGFHALTSASLKKTRTDSHSSHPSH